MKSKNMVLLAAVAMLVLLVSSYQPPVAAQEIISENLFENPGWESGYYNQDNIPQIAVPNGWRMHWLDNVAFPGTNGIVANRPETVVWNIQDAPPDERTVFFRDGAYTLKVFKGWAPMYAAVSQDVTGLEVGRKYRISAPIFVDIVESYDGGKVAPSDLTHGFVRFGVGPQGSAWRNASQINYSPTWTAANVNPFYLSMPIFIWDFVATSENSTIFIEMGSTYPHINNAFFMDGVGLYALNEKDGSVVSNNTGGGNGNSNSSNPAPSQPVETATAAPTPTPRADGSIVHVVGSGDTFWTIAIKYSSALEMTPEEALPHIQELNNNPAFISAGQELLIKEPGSAPPSAAEGAEEVSVSSSAAEGEAVEGGSDETIVVEGDAETEEAAPEAPAESATEAAPVAEDNSDASTGICVSAYTDLNGDGQRDEAVESLMSDAAITLFQAGTTVSTYITDGISEPHCFENLEVDAYEVRIFPPANYQATTSDSWAIAVSNGVMVPVTFGVQVVEQIAAVDSGTVQAAEGDAAADVESDVADDDAAQAEEPGGLFSNIGTIVLIIAVFLVILAGVGVVLLRRG